MMLFGGRDPPKNGPPNGHFHIKSLDLKTDKESKETEKILSDLGYI